MFALVDNPDVARWRKSPVRAPTDATDDYTTKGETMTSLTKESLAELVGPQSAPCLSLYQPTHRRHPENQQDPIRFRNLVKELEASLLQAYPASKTRLLLKPFDALASDHDFWNHTLDGLAVLAAPNLFRVFRLCRVRSPNWWSWGRAFTSNPSNRCGSSPSRSTAIRYLV